MLRRHVLREALPATVHLLATKRAQAIDDGFIDDYVALDWLEWRGGSLKLTVVGENICKQLSRLDQPVDPKGCIVIGRDALIHDTGLPDAVPSLEW